MLFLKIMSGWLALSNVILANLSEFSEEENSLARVKRAATDWQNTQIDLAIGTEVTGPADLGDSYVFTLRIQLPPVASLSPLSVLISGTDPEAGTSSIHLCSPDITKMDSGQITFSNASVKDTSKPQLLYRAEDQAFTQKAIFDFGELQTSSSAEIEIEWRAVVVPGTTQADTQYVNVGVLYDSGSFLWVGQQEVVTDVQSVTYTNTAEVKSMPTSLDRGGHGLLETEIIITEPFSDLTISAFNPLGFDDTFHLGEPVKQLGGSFGCTEEAKWERKPGQSISRKSVGKIGLSYKNLINLDSSRNSSSAENKISIKIPITALSDARPAQYAFTIGVELGPNTLISTTQDITITDQLAAAPSVTAGQTTGTVVALTPRVYPGGSAAFMIEVTVPGALNWLVKVTGSISHTAVGVLVHQTGLCAGFTSRYQTSSGSSYNADFGAVTNVDSDPTTVQLVVAFKVDTGAPAGAISESVTIDGTQYSLAGSEIVASPAAVGEISGTGEALGPTSFNTKFGAGVRSLINIPPTIINKPLTFKTYADDSRPDLQAETFLVVATVV